MTIVGAGFYFSVTAATATQTRQASTTYSYDKLYRLTGAGPTGSPATTTYSYDPTGNRLSKVMGGNSTSYTYDRSDRILTAGRTSYTLNNAGNLTARGSDGFSYDQANRLTGATTSTGSGTYVYDGDGKRVSKTVGGITTNYVYDVGGLPVLLDDGTQKYVWGNGLAYSVDKSSGAVHVYHADGLGSVRALTDNSGNVVQTYQTDEFGVPTESQGTMTQPFGYTGQPVDPESGLVYLRTRAYDPAAGRFMQRDPMGGGQLENPCTQNRQIYVQDNPVNRLDPTGLFTCSISLGTSVSTPASGGGSIGIGFDDLGQVGIFAAPQFGGSTSVGVSAGPSGALLNEPDVFHLSGPFVYLGASVTIPRWKLFSAAGELVYDPSRNNAWVGVQADIQAGYGPLSGELHGYESITTNVRRLSDFE